MKRTLRVIAVLLIITGGIWILQGVKILPGSFMTGQMEWAIYGAIALLAGIGLLLLPARHG